VTPRLIYDGDCAFCTRSARWIAARWVQGTATITPSSTWSDADLAAAGLTRADVDAAVWWIDDAGETERGDRAVAAALRAAPGWPRVVGRAISARPMRWIAPTAYRLVARNRHRLPGGTPACAAADRIAEG
jgi:predicted DCC family thiol-disulfide oxidoreductase YuxK